MDEKHFDEWIKLKENLHRIGRIPAIKEGEIWWCAVGENVGVEINGKNDVFSRPILIFRKINRLSFLGIPLTSQEKEGNWYTPFIFHGKQETAILVQLRVMSVSRLYDRIGTISNTDFTVIKEGMRKYLNL